MRQAYSSYLALVTGILVVFITVAFALIQSPEVFRSPESASLKAGKPIPHPIQGYENCASCHGPGEIHEYPINHVGWRYKSCTKCHES